MTFTTTLKPRRCKHCRDKFMPERMGQLIHTECIEGYCLALRARRQSKEKAAAKVKNSQERAQFKARKEAAEPIKKLIAKAQAAFNLFIRTRDAGLPCICCGQPFEPDKPGGSVDAGHYLGRGANPQHRFTEDNVFAQRKNCNRPGGTTRAAFRAGVIARIGLERVEALEADTAVRKWTRTELLDIKTTYTAKARQLKKEAA